MSSVSVAIMAHPSREGYIPALQKQLAEATVVWDQKNNRWDTGRRAVMAFDPGCEWHLVVQDDAILCPSFLPGVRAALAGVPSNHPVSFYTGKTRPYGPYIKKTVAQARSMGRSWIKMRGPLWGVAIALPVAMIEKMVAGADDLDIPNYDMRMAEWFHGQGIDCFYSVPSLVDHRVGSDNPSLVPGRGSGLGRVAHEFLAEGSPLDINWKTEASTPGDPSEYWTEENVCTRCCKRFDNMAEVIVHCFAKHQIGMIDFLASTTYHTQMLNDLRNDLPKDIRGKLYVVGADTSMKVPFEHERLNPHSAPRKMRKGYFMIVGAARDLKYIGNRSGWSLTCGTSN